MAFWPTYYLPVLRDSLSFRDRYDDLFRDFWGTTFPSRVRELSDWNDQRGRLLRDIWDLVPALEASSRTRPVHALEFTHPSQCFIQDPEGKPKFQVQFNVKNYKPEEISVSTQGNQLLISAKHEEKTEDMVEFREFNRRIDLPPNVLAETVTSALSSDGILSVSAPVQVPSIEAGKEEASEEQMQSQNAVIAKESPGPVTSHGPTAYFAFQLPVRGFLPEEIKIETVDRTVRISGTHEEKREGHEATYSFKKEYLLPPNADKDKLNVYIKDGRRLIVEAPIAESGQSQPTVHVLSVEHK